MRVNVPTWTDRDEMAEMTFGRMMFTVAEGLYPTDILLLPVDGRQTPKIRMNEAGWLTRD